MRGKAQDVQPRAMLLKQGLVLLCMPPFPLVGKVLEAPAYVIQGLSLCLRGLVVERTKAGMIATFGVRSTSGVDPSCCSVICLIKAMAVLGLPILI